MGTDRSGAGRLSRSIATGPVDGVHPVDGVLRFALGCSGGGGQKSPIIGRECGEGFPGRDEDAPFAVGGEQWGGGESAFAGRGGTSFAAAGGGATFTGCGGETTFTGSGAAARFAGCGGGTTFAGCGGGNTDGISSSACTSSQCEAKADRAGSTAVTGSSSHRDEWERGWTDGSDFFEPRESGMTTSAAPRAGTTKKHRSARSIGPRSPSGNRLSVRFWRGHLRKRELANAARGTRDEVDRIREQGITTITYGRSAISDHEDAGLRFSAEWRSSCSRT
jgi:hypothetical protein